MFVLFDVQTEMIVILKSEQTDCSRACEISYCIRFCSGNKTFLSSKRNIVLRASSLRNCIRETAGVDEVN